MFQIIQFVVGLIGCVGGLGPRTLHDLGFTQFPKVSHSSSAYQY
jgi:hypothetical protein